MYEIRNRVVINFRVLVGPLAKMIDCAHLCSSSGHDVFACHTKYPPFAGFHEARFIRLNHHQPHLEDQLCLSASIDKLCRTRGHPHNSLANYWGRIIDWLDGLCRCYPLSCRLSMLESDALSGSYKECD